MEEMEFSLIKRMNERLEKRDQQSLKKEHNLGEELFAQALALDLKQLPQYERCIAKGELTGIIMKHQMAVLEKQMRTSYGISPSDNRIPSPASYSEHLQGILSFLPRPKHLILIHLYGRKINGRINTGINRTIFLVK